MSFCAFQVFEGAPVSCWQRGCSKTRNWGLDWAMRGWVRPRGRNPPRNLGPALSVVEGPVLSGAEGLSHDGFRFALPILRLLFTRMPDEITLAVPPAAKPP